MGRTQVTQLVSRIALNTAKVTGYLDKHGLPFHSFDKDAPSKSMILPHAVDIGTARVAVIDDTQALRLLMLGPLAYLTSFTHDELISMQVIMRYRIASTVPIDGEVEFKDIGRKYQLPESDVKRIMRHAIVKSVFVERRPGVVAHNAVSRLLAEDEKLNDWVGANTDEFWQMASQTTTRCSNDQVVRSQLKLVSTSQITMKEVQNAREREMKDWQMLFAKADSRFNFHGGTQPEGSMLWILEARWYTN